MPSIVPPARSSRALRLSECPENIRSDNDPEFTARAVRDWLGKVGVKTLRARGLLVAVLVPLLSTRLAQVGSPVPTARYNVLPVPT